MTNETKKLFDAPWIVYGEPDDYSFVIQNASEDEIATVFMTDEANRFARLPELYDALNKQAYYRCVDCLRHTANTIDDIPLNRDMIEHGCPKNRTDCGAFDAWKLLRKVRDGK